MTYDEAIEFGYDEDQIEQFDDTDDMKCKDCPPDSIGYSDGINECLYCHCPNVKKISDNDRHCECCGEKYKIKN